MNNYLTFIVFFTSISMIFLFMVPLAHGEENGWWEIRDGKVHNLSGPLAIERIFDTNLYVVLEDLTGTIRIFDPDVILQGVNDTIDITGRLTIWTDADNVIIRDLTFKGDGTMVALQGCEGATVKDCTFLDGAMISPSGYATHFAISNNTFINTDPETTRIAVWVWQCGYGGTYPDLTLEPSLIYGNQITGYKSGIYLQSSAGTIIYGNSIKNSVEKGIYSYGSAASIIFGNTINGNGDDGILLTGSPENIIAVNLIGGDNENPDKSSHRNGDNGIEVSDGTSTNNTIWNNYIWGNTNGGYGIRSRAEALNNLIINNNFMGDGRHIYYAANNNWSAGYYHLDLSEKHLEVFHNWSERYAGWLPKIEKILTKIGQSIQLQDNIMSLSSIRFGNYWQSYTDTDEKKGPDQDLKGSDKIWDKEYTTAGVYDRYPLVEPYQFQTPQDHDGVPDWVEDLAPNGDGNNDGVPDSLQSEVASTPLHPESDVQGFMTLGVTPPGELVNVRPLPPPKDPPDYKGITEQFPYGMYSFEAWNVAKGDFIDFTLTVPYDPSMTIERLWKKNNLGIWEQIEIVVIDDDPVRKISFQLREGGIFDQDKTANGRLVDDAGLATIPEPLMVLILTLLYILRRTLPT